MQHKIIRGYNGHSYYPWDEMKVGDYFETPIAGINWQSVRVQASKQKRKNGRVFTVMTKDHVLRVTRHE